MKDVSRRAHWENVYTTKSENEVSWFQDNPAPSLELIDLAQPTPETTIVDIGGGASRLVDSLVARGLHQVTELNVSEAALATAKTRLGDEPNVQWVAADVTHGSHRKPMTSGTIGQLSTSSRTTVKPTSRA